MKIIRNDIAILEHDTHISKWVAQKGTLAIAEPMLKPFKHHIPVNGTVVDVGANIGDHTVTYAKWVGLYGVVLAFEPNPEPYKCLVYNTNTLPQVKCIQKALSDYTHTMSMVTDFNVGASHTVQDNNGSVSAISLDSLNLQRLDFIKLDIEGFETRAIVGAADTLRRCQPVMLVEVNSGALRRAGTTPEALLKLIESLGYTTEITDHRLNWSCPQFDIICLPTKKPLTA